MPLALLQTVLLDLPHRYRCRWPCCTLFCLTYRTDTGAVETYRTDTGAVETYRTDTGAVETYRTDTGAVGLAAHPSGTGRTSARAARAVCRGRTRRLALVIRETGTALTLTSHLHSYTLTSHMYITH